MKGMGMPHETCPSGHAQHDHEAGMKSGHPDGEHSPKTVNPAVKQVQKQKGMSHKGMGH